MPRKFLISRCLIRNYWPHLCLRIIWVCHSLHSDRTSALGPGCVKTPPLSDGRSRLQMQRAMPLTSLGGDNGLSVSALASSENWTGLKAVLSVHFYVFTQPGSIADTLDCPSNGYRVDINKRSSKGLCNLSMVSLICQTCAETEQSQHSSHPSSPVCCATWVL